MRPAQLLSEGDAILAVDVQNDFCPGGALAVKDGDKVVPVLNLWLEAAAHNDIPVIASRDWHPVDHCSFHHQGGPWPVHCVQDTKGAAFHSGLQLPSDAIRVSKGTAFDRDAYSAFDGTGLAGYLKQRGVKRLWVGGLAQDVCVLETVKSACQSGFETHLLVAATRAVDLDNAAQSLQAMRQAGAQLVEDG
ncbi:isochorismatase family protein [Halomonas sp. LS-001]